MNSEVFKPDGRLRLSTGDGTGRLEAVVEAVDGEADRRCDRCCGDGGFLQRWPEEGGRRSRGGFWVSEMDVVGQGGGGETGSGGDLPEMAGLRPLGEDLARSRCRGGRGSGRRRAAGKLGSRDRRSRGRPAIGAVVWDSGVGDDDRSRRRRVGEGDGGRRRQGRGDRRSGRRWRREEEFVNSGGEG